MKTIKLPIICLSFILLNAVAISAQTWQWGKEGRPVNLPCPPYPQATFATVKAVASDLNGNVFETGNFYDTLYFGADKLFSRVWRHCPASLVAENPFLVKYDSTGNVVWARQGVCPGIGEGWANSISADDSGNIYETGYFTDTISFGPIRLLYTSRPGYANGGYIVKYSASGSVVWAKQFTKDASASSVSQGYGVYTDGRKYLYLAGMFEDTIVFGADTLKTTSLYSGADAFLAKFDLNGNIIWVKQSEVQVGYGYALAVASDKGNNVYITGYFEDSISFGTNKLRNTGFNSTAAFIVKYDSGGNVLWAKEGDNSADITGYSSGTGIIVDGSGASYTTGYFKKSMKLAPYTLYSDSADLFIVKYNSSGNVVWAMKGNRLDSSNWYSAGLSSDTLNHIYLTANASNINYVPPYYKIAFGTDTLTSPKYSCILSEFDTSGKFLCGSFIPYAGYGGGPLITTNATGRYIYIGDGIGNITAHDTAFYGPDTLTYFGVPFTARWETCQSNLTTAVNELKRINNLSVFPNPFTNSTTILINPNGKHYLELDDVTGRKLRYIEFTGNEYILNAQDLAKGLYFVRVYDNQNNVIGTTKIVVQ